MEDNRDRKEKGIIIDLYEIWEENLVWQRGNDLYKDLDDCYGKYFAWKKYSSIGIQSERFFQVDLSILGESGTAWHFDEEATQVVNEKTTKVANKEGTKIANKERTKFLNEDAIEVPIGMAEIFLGN